MSAPTVQVETRGAVALVTLNRPDSGNALNLQMAMDLLAAAMTCARNSAVRAVVLSGAGRNFCFGGDLRAMASRDTAGDDYIRELTTYLHAAISQLRAHGRAGDRGRQRHGGWRRRGTGCHGGPRAVRTSSKFNLAYTNAGLTPDAGTSFLLPRMLGVKRTMELLLLNRTLPAAEALAWGLVNEVVSDEQLLERALEIAEQLAQGPSGAYGATKRLLAHSLGALESQMVLESETIASHAVGAEGTEGIRAFLEKRKPHFPDKGSR